jgi:hypothetical protein
MVNKTKYLLESNKHKLCTALKTYIDKIPFDNFDEDLFYRVFTNEFFEEFPYIELVYVLDKDGVQISDNVVNPIFSSKIPKKVKGYDRSNRPYYKEVIAKKRLHNYTAIYIYRDLRLNCNYINSCIE